MKFYYNDINIFFDNKENKKIFIQRLALLYFIIIRE